VVDRAHLHQRLGLLKRRVHRFILLAVHDERLAPQPTRNSVNFFGRRRRR
jgi:hypothetical protein